jgi:hypothetical protein
MYSLLYVVNSRNQNQKNKVTPVLIPLSPNKYSENNDHHWSVLKQYSLTQTKLVIRILVYFNIIGIDYGYIKLQKAQSTEDWKVIEKLITRIYIKSQVEWKKDLFENIQENKSYSLFDLYCIFFDDKKLIEVPSVYSENILDEKGKVIKKNGRKLKHYHNTNKGIYQKIKDINQVLCDKGYSELQYKQIYGTNSKELGRLYSPFQNIRSEEREQCFKELGLYEWDFKSFVPSLIYELETGKKPNIDFYQIILDRLNLPIEYRSIITGRTCNQITSIKIWSIYFFKFYSNNRTD